MSERLERIKRNITECDNLHPAHDHEKESVLEDLFVNGDIHYLIEKAERLNYAEPVIGKVAKLNDFISTHDVGFVRLGQSVVDIAIDELKRYKAENERLREALEFYANEDNNLLVDGENTTVSIDAGRIARKALGVEEE